MTPARFDPAQARVFTFAEARFDPTSGEARWSYHLDDESFTEVITLVDLPPLPGPREQAVRRLLEIAFVVAGTSYYKAAAPPALADATGIVARYGGEFFRQVYLHGLGEYAYVNRLDLADRLEALTGLAGQPAPSPLTGLDLRPAPVVAVGGGKDSVVTVEALRPWQPLLFTVGNHRAVADTVAVAGLPLARVTRALDPRLFALNARGARNGHVPVTAVVMLLAAATAVAHGRDAVAMSNERSASEGNLPWAGRTVNHQWSKGSQFEGLLAGVLHERVSPELDVFSLLRPLSELSIARRFAGLTSYHPVVTSCNAAFRLDAGRRVRRWCGHCPKCRFVFLALAPWLDRADLLSIFEGLDLYADPTQQEGFLALTGVDADKPFECVGEVVESRVALRLAYEGGQWADSPAFATLVQRVRAAGWPTPAQVGEVLADDPGSLVPARYTGALGAADPAPGLLGPPPARPAEGPVR